MAILPDLELLLYLYLGEGLEDVALEDVVVVDQTDTTLHTCGYLLHIVLIALERVDRSGLDHDTVADDARL